MKSLGMGQSGVVVFQRLKEPVWSFRTHSPRSVPTNSRPSEVVASDVT